MRVRALLFLLCMSYPGMAAAQFDSGQIAGVVRDQSGSATPGATITVQNEGNKDKRETVTNATGFFAFPDLPVGSYTVTVQLSGFRRFVQTSIKLSAAARLSVDVQLEVGNLNETVEVKASTSAVQTGTAQVARTVDSRQIQELM